MPLPPEGYPSEVHSRRWLMGAALLGAPLLRFVLGLFFRVGEEIDLLGDDLASVAGLALGVGPAGVVDPRVRHRERERTLPLSV